MIDDNIVSLVDVCMNYQTLEGETPALKNINLDVKEGEFIGIVGPSGCGKTTILSLISGLIKPCSGKVLVQGKEVEGPSPMVGYMLQQDYLFEWRNIFQNVMLGLEVLGKDNDENREKVNKLLDTYGLSEFKKHYPRQLSGGMRQRAALLRTYLMDGEIMLLDEPFGALDEITRMQMQDWLISVWEKHKKTVLFVTHDIDEAIYLSDRVLVMSDRPGTINGEIQINIERPRKREMILTSQFSEYKKNILKLLKT